MDLVGGSRPARQSKVKRPNGDGIGLNSDIQYVLDLKLLRVVSRSLFFTFAFLALPSIGFIASSGFLSSDSDLPAAAVAVAYGGPESDSINVELLKLVLHDVAGEGLLNENHNALVVSSCRGDLDLIRELQSLNGNPVEVVLGADLSRQSSIPDGKFDFTYASGAGETELHFVDRVTRIGGVAAVQSSNGALGFFQEAPNYRMVYLRRFNSTTIAVLRKTGASKGRSVSPEPRRVCAFSEARNAAVKGLEGALLEPPRRALNDHLKESVKFLSDALGENAMKRFRRRVFINVGSPEWGGVDEGIGWFRRWYPKGGEDFEVYALEGAAARGVSEWLQREVGEGEFVVVKAEAGVAVELMKGRGICVVDELFLECGNEWEQQQRQPGRKKKGQGNRRAYWECLALFGKLRDEGVAVHQWWGWGWGWG